MKLACVKCAAHAADANILNNRIQLRWMCVCGTSNNASMLGIRESVSEKLPAPIAVVGATDGDTIRRLKDLKGRAERESERLTLYAEACAKAMLAPASRERAKIEDEKAAAEKAAAEKVAADKVIAKAASKDGLLEKLLEKKAADAGLSVQELLAALLGGGK